MKNWKVPVPFLAVSLASVLMPISGLADTNAEVLKEITDTADKICGYVAQAGSISSVEVKGDVKAELTGLFKRLADLGVSGVGSIDETRYEGLVHEQLADTLTDIRRCKTSIFNTLQQKLLPSHPQRSTVEYNKNAIDTIVSLIDEGNKISDAFLATNDVDQIGSQYREWVTKVDKALRDKLDASYAVQFRNALPFPGVRSGMAVAGAGYWQHLMGSLSVLNSFIIELRHASQ